MIERLPTLSWDLSAVAKSLHLTQDEAIDYFTDGRRVSFILERRLCRVIGGRLAPSEGAGFDLIDQYDCKWEVRSITKRIYFCPSYMVGKGRFFDEDGFLRKLDEIEGYILSDVMRFPDIPVWKVSQEVVRDWYRRGELGARTSVSRARILDLLAS